MNRRELLLSAASAIALPIVGAPRRVAAQAYPSRPIRIIVPSSPGGVHDIVARLWAERLKGVASFVVENRSGAGTIIGTVEVARAEPDGYAILLGSTNTHILQPLSTNRPSYDPIKDFTPIFLIGTTATAIAINPKIPVHTLGELIAYVKANPGKLSYGHGGTGTNTHLSGELFKQLAGGLDIVSVPYKGLAPAFGDVVSGQISMVFANVTNQVIGFHTADQIRLISINAAERLEAAPEIPTSKESGLPGMISQTFFAMFAPANTPKPILDALNEPTQAALRDPEFRKKLSQSGYDPLTGYGPEEARRFIAAEYTRWEPIVRGIKVQN